MTSASKFRVAYDEKRRRLTWTMWGFWDLTDVAALGAALRAAVAPLGPPPLQIDSLCDSTDFPVQSQAVAEALGAIERVGAALNTGRVAIVVGSMMNKLQVQRALSAKVRAFRSLEEAEAWLDTPEG